MTDETNPNNNDNYQFRTCNELVNGSTQKNDGHKEAIADVKRRHSNSIPETREAQIKFLEFQIELFTPKENATQEQHIKGSKDLTSMFVLMKAIINAVEYERSKENYFEPNYVFNSVYYGGINRALNLPASLREFNRSKKDMSPELVIELLIRAREILEEQICINSDFYEGIKKDHPFKLVHEGLDERYFAKIFRAIAITIDQAKNKIYDKELKIAKDKHQKKLNEIDERRKESANEKKYYDDLTEIYDPTRWFSSSEKPPQSIKNLTPTPILGEQMSVRSLKKEERTEEDLLNQQDDIVEVAIKEKESQLIENNIVNKKVEEQLANNGDQQIIESEEKQSSVVIDQIEQEEVGQAAQHEVVNSVQQQEVLVQSIDNQKENKEKQVQPQQVKQENSVLPKNAEQPKKIGENPFTFHSHSHSHSNNQNQNQVKKRKNSTSKEKPVTEEQVKVSFSS